jgi:para-aminobenzoate synthetase component 1
MLKVDHLNFEAMDEFSQKKIPFFFITDFLAEKVEIYTEADLKLSGLVVEFKNYKKENVQQNDHTKIVLK